MDGSPKQEIVLSKRALAISIALCVLSGISSDYLVVASIHISTYSNPSWLY